MIIFSPHYYGLEDKNFDKKKERKNVFAQTVADWVPEPENNWVDWQVVTTDTERLMMIMTPPHTQPRHLTVLQRQNFIHCISEQTPPTPASAGDIQLCDWKETLGLSSVSIPGRRCQEAKWLQFSDNYVDLPGLDMTVLELRHLDGKCLCGEISDRNWRGTSDWSNYMERYQQVITICRVGL